MARVPFVGGTDAAKSVNSSTQRTVNWIPEQDREAKFPMRLIPRPGLATFANVGSAEVRGLLVFGGNLYAVVGGDVKQITTSGVVTNIGTVNTTTGTVGMARGTTQFMIVDGTNGYYSDGSTVTTITDGDFPDTATSVAWMDTYFIVNDPSNAGRAYRSDANDASSWGSLNFATAERAPDDLVAIIVKQRELWLMGAQTTEVWYNDGSDGFSFAPIDGGFTEVGTIATHSVAKGGGALFWLARSAEGVNAVFMATGLVGQRISTEAIENDIADAGSTTNAIGDVIYHRGHLLYILTLPNGKTLVWDAQTQLWHEWKTYLLVRFRGQHFVQFNNKPYCGDFQDGNIWLLDPASFTDNGVEIECIRRDRHIVNSEDRRLVGHNALELEFEMGVGTATLNPAVLLRWSDDGGHQWSNWHRRALGKIGRYSDAAIWRNLGASEDRVYETKITDPVSKTLIGGYLDMSL